MVSKALGTWKLSRRNSGEQLKAKWHRVGGVLNLHVDGDVDCLQLGLIGASTCLRCTVPALNVKRSGNRKKGIKHKNKSTN